MEFNQAGQQQQQQQTYGAQYSGNEYYPAGQGGFAQSQGE